MTRILIVSLLLFSCLPLRAQNTVTGALEGYVVSSADDKPIKGLIVKLTNVVSKVSYTQRTDDKGFFRQGLLLPGAYVIEISAPGYKPFSARQYVVATVPNQVTSPIRLEPDVSATGTFEGYVVKKKGVPIKDATVKFTSIERGTVYQTKTDKSGVFRSPGLPPGGYELSISAKGYESFNKRQYLVATVPNQVNPLPVVLERRK
jgi:hypothetical protein